MRIYFMATKISLFEHQKAKQYNQSGSQAIS